MEYLILDGQSLTLEKLICAIRYGKKVMLSEAAEVRVVQARQTLEIALVSKRVIYGINTGFGALSEVVISKDEKKQLQKNILMSHAPALEITWMKRHPKQYSSSELMTLRRDILASRLETLKTLVEMYNKGIYPLMPEKGSVGASGDLVLSQHCYVES